MSRALSVRRVVVLFAVTLCFSVPSWAAFTGAYAPANWTTFTQTFGCGSSQVNIAGMPNTLVLRTSTACANIGAGYTLTGTLPANGTLSFNWSYDSTSFNDAGVITSATYSLGGVVTTLASNDGPQNGVVSIPVVAGQSFAFTLNGSTNAVFTITNFNAPPAPPVATVQPVPTVDTWAKIGLAALLALVAIWKLRNAQGSTGRNSRR